MLAILNECLEVEVTIVWVDEIWLYSVGRGIVTRGRCSRHCAIGSERWVVGV